MNRNGMIMMSEMLKIAWFLKETTEKLEFVDAHLTEQRNKKNKKQLHAKRNPESYWNIFIFSFFLLSGSRSKTLYFVASN